jgi:hypothetical protein
MKILTGFATILSLGLTSCDGLSKKEKNKDSQTPGGDQFSVDFPSETQNNTVDYLEIDEGEYRIAEILTNVEGLSPEVFTTSFKQVMAKQGNPDDEDKVERSADFSKIDKGENLLSQTVEINLPLTIVKDGVSVSFLKKHYYYNQTRSDGSWRWRITGSESPNGDQIARFFEQAQKEGDFYTVSTNSLTKTITCVQPDKNTLYLYVMQSQSDLVQKYRLTYKK